MNTPFTQIKLDTLIYPAVYVEMCENSLDQYTSYHFTWVYCTYTGKVRYAYIQFHM